MPHVLPLVPSAGVFTSKALPPQTVCFQGDHPGNASECSIVEYVGMMWRKQQLGPITEVEVVVTRSTLVGSFSLVHVTPFYESGPSDGTTFVGIFALMYTIGRKCVALLEVAVADDEKVAALLMEKQICQQHIY